MWLEQAYVRNYRLGRLNHLQSNAFIWFKNYPWLHSSPPMLLSSLIMTTISTKHTESLVKISTSIKNLSVESKAIGFEPIFTAYRLQQKEIINTSVQPTFHYGPFCSSLSFVLSKMQINNHPPHHLLCPYRQEARTFWAFKLSSNVWQLKQGNSTWISFWAGP